MLWEGWAVVADQDVFRSGWNMVHAVLEEAFVYALHVFIDRAHFCRSYELCRKAQPGVLVSFARVIYKFYRVVVLAGLIVVIIITRLLRVAVVLLVRVIIFVAGVTVHVWMCVMTDQTCCM